MTLRPTNCTRKATPATVVRQKNEEGLVGLQTSAPGLEAPHGKKGKIKKDTAKATSAAGSAGLKAPRSKAWHLRNRYAGKEQKSKTNTNAMANHNLTMTAIALSTRNIWLQSKPNSRRIRTQRSAQHAVLCTHLTGRLTGRKLT